MASGSQAAAIKKNQVARRKTNASKRSPKRQVPKTFKIKKQSEGDEAPF